MPLIPILLALIAGKSITAIIAALSIPQWIDIAFALFKLDIDAINTLRKLHPAFVILHNQLHQGTENAAHMAHEYAQRHLRKTP